MDLIRVMYERCCGIDVHKKSLTAAVITPEGRAVRTFGTMTAQLLELVDWLVSQGVTHVAMESTGVYWKPVFNVLEATERIEVVLVNAHHLKTVPGRKTDVKDAEWIAECLRHGLVRKSFVPDRPQRELRELVRYRRSLIDERAREVNRVQKVLEGANIKLGDVATDVMGKSGRTILQEMARGESDPDALAELARGRLRPKISVLKQALNGLMGEHQRTILAEQLGHIADLETRIARLDAMIEERMRPFEEAIDRLRTIPGIERTSAEEILAYTGVDMSQFPNEHHLASWCHVSPGNNESAGKRKSGRTPPGKLFVRNALIRAATSAARTKSTYLSAQYHRIAARRGAKRARVAVAHTMIVIIYHLLTKDTTYRELGGNYFDHADEAATVKRLTRRLQALGYNVTLQPVA